MAATREDVVGRVAIAVLALLLAGCSSGGPEPQAGTPSAASSASTTPPDGTAAPATTRPRSPEFDQALHDELIAMAERDQSGRTGGPDPEGDAARTLRLAEILDQHGWPTYDLVGEDGEDAAWTIAQHSDQDPAVQRRALELLRAAVEDDQASPGNLAYLDDRVAAGAGEPQTYGTQINCTPEGAEPAPPLADEAAVDDLRAEAGLGPLADYLAEMAAICSE
jgi:hypothetical protein